MRASSFAVIPALTQTARFAAQLLQADRRSSNYLAERPRHMPPDGHVAGSSLLTGLGNLFRIGKQLWIPRSFRPCTTLPAVTEGTLVLWRPGTAFLQRFLSR